MTDTNTPPQAPGPGNGDQQQRPHCNGRGGHRRRRWFALGAALVIGLTGFGVGRASAHFHHWRMGPGFGRAIDVDTASQRAEIGIGRALSGVDGTPEQKAKISQIAKSAIADLLPLRERMNSARDKLAAALKSDTVDKAAIEQLRNELAALMETVSKRASQALTDSADVLSPAQRAKLVDRWQAWSRRG